MFDQKFIDDLNHSLINKGDYLFHRNNNLLKGLFKLFENVEYVKTPIKYKIKGYSFGDMKALISSAFLDIDERLYNRLERMFNNPDYHHNVFYDKSDNRYGDNSCGTHGDGVHVNITFDNTARGLLTVGHEYVHAIGGRNVKKIKPKEDSIGEIESLFMEKVLADYFLKEGIIDKREYEMFKSERNNSFINDLNFVLENERILSSIQIPVTKEQLENLEQELILEKDGEYVLKTLYNYPKENKTSSCIARYIVGEMVASLLYEKYKMDKEGTMNKFIEFIDNNEIYELEEATRLLINKEPHEVLEYIIQRTR